MNNNSNVLLSADIILKSLCDNSPTHIILVALDYTIQYINFTVPDFTPEEVIGISVVDLTPVDYHKVTLDCYQRVKETGKFDKYETKFISKDRQVYYFEVTISPVFNNEDILVGYISSSNNITSKKQIENKLLNSESHYRSLFEKMKSGFAYHEMLFDNNGKPVDYVFLVVNNEFEEQTGLSKDEIIGKKVTQILPGIKDDPAGLIGIYGNVVLTGESYFSQTFSEPLSKWFSVNAYQTSSKNFAVIFQDISDQKHAEKALLESEMRYKALNDASFGGIAIHDKGVILECNKGLSEMSGYSMEEMIGMDGLLLIAEESRDYVIGKIQSGYEKSYEAIGIRKNQEQFPVRLEGRNVPYKGKVVRSVEFRDITEQKLAEEELSKVSKLESIGLLAGGIAHDFNNILTGLFGNIELAKRKMSPDHPSYNYIKNADNSLEKATNLTQQLLTFAKGGDPLIESININKVIRAAVSLALRESNLKVDLNLSDDIWHINADKGQLSQVIINLVMNAVHATDDEGVLSIVAENVQKVDEAFAPHQLNEAVKLTISDNGVGISKENQNRIFDPYFSTKKAGGGLGLATVHSIIKKHNGFIEVNSERNVGTTFTIYLPADISEHHITEVVPSSEAEESKVKTSHILVMDDDEMIRTLSTEIIVIFGYTVDTAVDGKEALEKYVAPQKSGNPIDVVIMDLTIPGGMGGKEAIKELLKIDPEAKVIVASGYSTDSIMANYMDYGFKGRLLKPFQMDELKKALTQLIE